MCHRILINSCVGFAISKSNTIRVGRLGIPAQQLEKISFHLTQFLKV